MNPALEALEEALEEALAEEGVEATKPQIEAVAQGVADWVEVMSGAEYEAHAWQVDPMFVGPYWSRVTLRSLAGMLRRGR